MDALGHTEVVDAAEAATCTETGLTEGKHCSVCDKILVAQETVAAKGHAAGAVVVENEVAADCENTGSYENVTYCTVCDEELSREKVTVDALGHKNITKVADEYLKTAATCTERAVYYMSCEVCGAKGTATFTDGEPMGHTDGEVVVENEVAADCENTGS